MIIVSFNILNRGLSDKTIYGYGKSSHNKEKYNILSQGDDLIEFIQYKTDEKISILYVISDYGEKVKFK